MVTDEASIMAGARKYKTDRERKAAKLASHRQYGQTEKGKATVKRYARSKKGIATAKKARDIRLLTEKGITLFKQNWRKQGLKRYNLTFEDYDQIFTEQNGCCAICGKHQSEFKTRLAVDHSHKTGQVRGLLCTNCNTKLGWWEKHQSNIKRYLRVRR